MEKDAAAGEIDNSPPRTENLIKFFLELRKFFVMAGGRLVIPQSATVKYFIEYNKQRKVSVRSAKCGDKVVDAI